MTQREEVTRCSREQVGKRYVHATAGPNTFDCSGLVHYCYAKVGVDVSRGSVEQWEAAKRSGQTVSVRDAQPGDLIFWGWHQADHVGILAEGGTVINALNEQRGVVQTALTADYGMPLLGAASLIATSKPTESSNVTPPEQASSSEGKPNSGKARRRRNRRKDRP